ncbi:MAG: hypothetical protein AABZ80_00570 [Gemmatimonadota bacterium]
MVLGLIRWTHRGGRAARRVARSASVTLLAFGLACLGGPTGPKLIGEGRRVLFIGNSYLYLQDIPGIVQALADSAKGDKLAIETVAGPDMALVDHWVSGAARGEVLKGGWEWVVLQQGPSSVAVNRDTLRLVTKLFADLMAPGKAKPALFSAWPSSSRFQDFPRAIASYSLAASDVNGVFLPVASAWLGAWSRDPSIELYLDDLHPSIEGAYLSALVVYGRLLGKSTKGLPNGLRLHSGASFTIPASVAATLQAAADSALASTP